MHAQCLMPLYNCINGLMLTEWLFKWDDSYKWRWYFDFSFILLNCPLTLGNVDVTLW